VSFKTGPIKGAEDTTRMIITEEGRIGMGTSEPNGVLHIKEATDVTPATLRLENTGKGGAKLWVHNADASHASSILLFRNSNLSNNGANYWVIGNDRSDGNKFKIAPFSTIEDRTVFTVARNSRVGIGTNNPKGKLHVKANGG